MSAAPGSNRTASSYALSASSNSPRSARAFPRPACSAAALRRDRPKRKEKKLMLAGLRGRHIGCVAARRRARKGACASWGGQEHSLLKEASRQEDVRAACLPALQLLQRLLQGLDGALLRRLVAGGPQGLECVLGLPEAVGGFADHVQVEPAVAVEVEQADTALAPQGTQLGLLGADFFEYNQKIQAEQLDLFAERLDFSRGFAHGGFIRCRGVTPSAIGQARGTENAYHHHQRQHQLQLFQQHGFQHSICEQGNCRGDHYRVSDSSIHRRIDQRNRYRSCNAL